MSLAITEDRVTSVLIGGEWFDVVPGTFHTDAYEYVSNTGSYQYPVASIRRESTGFTFTSLVDPRNRVSGPLDAIQAVIESRP